jgi:small-conductance mechanosensitive channel
VIDIGLLRTTLMETGNWVSKDLYNGRIARIPNSTILKVSVFNHSQGFRFIWDEIKVVLTGTSNPQLARAEVADSNGRLKWASSAITLISQPVTPEPTGARQTSASLRAGEAGSSSRDR